MAPFNPAIQPTQDPDYSRTTRPISDLVPDKSSAILISGMGDALEGGVKIADTAVKDQIKSDLYTRIDKERDAFTADLQQTKAVLNSGNDQTLVAANDTPNIPTSVAQSLNKVSAVQAGLDGGKISKTEYDMRLGAIAKDLRSSYPGYREYIDSEVGKITGGTPANEVIASSIADINRMTAKRSGEQDKTLSFIRSHSNVPGAPEVMAAYSSGRIDANNVFSWGADYDGKEANLKLKKLQSDSDTGDKNTNIANATDYAQSLTSTLATQGFYAVKFSQDTKTGAQIADTVTDLQSGKIKADDVQKQNLLQHYQALKTQTYNQAMGALFTKNKDTGKSVADTIGADTAKKMVETNVNALFDSTADLMANDKWGAAKSNLNRATAVVNDATMNVLESNVGKEIALTAAVNKLAPNVAPVLLQKAMTNGLDTKVKALMESKVLRAASGFDLAQTGKPGSFSKDVDDVKKAVGPNNGKAFNSLVNMSSFITAKDPNVTDEIKINTINHFFGPDNDGSLNKIASKEGKYNVYTRLTSDDIAGEVWRLSQNGNKKLWDNYSTWAKNSFGKDLLGTDILNLNDLFGNNKYHVSYSSGKDGSNPQFNIVNANGTPFSGLQASNINSTARTINNLNWGLSSIATIAKKEGTNVDAYVWKTLYDAGYRPNKAVEGVPSKLMNALIIKNGGKIDPNAPQVPISKFAPEDVGSDLQSFLTNPAGSRQPSRPLVNDTLEPQQTRGVIQGNLSDQPIGAPIRMSR